MKVNVEVECSPEEARRFLGLPDVTKANEVYVDALTNAMKGAGNFDQLQELTKQIAPMGEFGLKMFQQFIESGVAMAMSGGNSPSGKPKNDK
ncbi:MAG: hypothetical protein CMH85_13195 [Novosphingobium sp.]|jgi:hypothetical protein|uniref:Uncharacterized protein n=1 Tax=Novosphingobium indicum TaxID=462949 RepID=A0ABQ2J948_9SPHN|nr:DUF6489 family protein [Novosphingobium indicum]MAC59201.1 hypothetical protein [Novosphingobium sp.]GGN40914.1 hypothetical protein GCM10011349_02280 [Novosphingobium indicum]|tara:strand:+ start:515 stop:790 length:276 start_codon:yes stop_codon:yes gene_type:complete